VSQEDQSRLGEGGPVATGKGAVPRLPEIPAYVVLMIIRDGTPRRKVYLDLGHARAAVERTRKRGLLAELVLVRLVPVTGDLDGGWSE
jgi:hypothetical protein